jgi:hypothetical protein
LARRVQSPQRVDMFRRTKTKSFSIAAKLRMDAKKTVKHLD